MSKQVMSFCDFCGIGFEEAADAVKERNRLIRDEKAAGIFDANDEKHLLICAECAERLKKSDIAAAEYFAQLLLNGVMLKNAYYALAKRTVFAANLTAYALRLKACPSQRQDGKKSLKLKYAPGTLPPMVFGVDLSGLNGKKEK
ncbi:MAG: hypothetical protein LBT30_03950 [Clostridiales bacterium]|jgi:hypothetical protein|nr:hypothetical protein [Clostridiales bacterium]